MPDHSCALGLSCALQVTPSGLVGDQGHLCTDSSFVLPRETRFIEIGTYEMLIDSNRGC